MAEPRTCAGVVPGTFYICGEAGQYCSDECVGCGSKPGVIDKSHLESARETPTSKFVAAAVEALGYYADGESYRVDNGRIKVLFDHGKLALEALKLKP